MRNVLLPALALLAACPAPPPEAGEAAVCFGNSRGDDLDFETTVFDVTGAARMVTEPANDGLLACGEGVIRFVEITDGDGVIWTLGYGVLDDRGREVSEDLDLTEGEEVTLRFRYVQSWGSAHGFTLSDADGLVAAVDVGSWGNALEPEDFDGLTVTNGEAFAHEPDACGRGAHYVTRFEGDEVVEVEAFGSGTVQVGGVPYTAFAVRNHGWDGEVRCEDVAAQRLWAIFR